MPCYVTGSAEGDLRLSLDEATEELQEVTRLLCELCRLWPSDAKMPKAVRGWWDAHQKLDLAREQERAETLRCQQLQKQALNKLTVEERVALGLGTT